MIALPPTTTILLPGSHHFSVGVAPEDFDAKALLATTQVSNESPWKGVPLGCAHVRRNARMLANQRWLIDSYIEVHSRRWDGLWLLEGKRWIQIHSCINFNAVDFGELVDG